MQSTYWLPPSSLRWDPVNLSTLQRQARPRWLPLGASPFLVSTGRKWITATQILPNLRSTWEWNSKIKRTATGWTSGHRERQATQPFVPYWDSSESFRELKKLSHVATDTHPSARSLKQVSNQRGSANVTPCNYWRNGFSHKEIGNKSIQSGVAMALSLKGHSAEKIMLLGRWKSTCFLDYIRPQVIEWVNLFSLDMISFEHFFEVFTPSDKRKIGGSSLERWADTK